MSNDTSKSALPFHKSKQNALVGHMLTNEKFFLQCKDTIEPGWFADPNANQIFTVMRAFHTAIGRAWVSKDELTNCTAWMKLENKHRIRLVNVLDDFQALVQTFPLDALSKELTVWLHSRMYIVGMQESSELFNSQKFDEAYDIARRTVEDIDKITFDGNQSESFLNFNAEFKKAESILLGNTQFLCTTGLDIFDRALLPDASGKGAFQPGDTTLLLAPTNVGKTTTMITILLENLRRGKRILFLTHEGRPQDIKEKIWMNMMGMTRQQLFATYKSTDPVITQRFMLMAKGLETYLTYLPMNKAGLTVEEVERVIRRRQEMMVATSKDGRGYDLVVCDYPAKLSTVQASKGQLARRQIDDLVYNRFVQLALEYDFHVLSAIQTNRDGSKANKGRGDGRKRLVFMEDVSEAWGPMTTATNVISINRDDDAVANNTVTFLICKSRSSETGWAILCKSRYDIATTHSNTFGATMYRAGAAEHVNTNALLTKYNGKEVPNTALQFEESEDDSKH